MTQKRHKTTSGVSDMTQFDVAVLLVYPGDESNSATGIYSRQFWRHKRFPTLGPLTNFPLLLLNCTPGICDYHLKDGTQPERKSTQHHMQQPSV